MSYPSDYGDTEFEDDFDDEFEDDFDDEFENGCHMGPVAAWRPQEPLSHPGGNRPGPG